MDEDIEAFENAGKSSAATEPTNLALRAQAENSLEVAETPEEAAGIEDYLEYLDECANEPFRPSKPLRFACIGSREISDEMNEIMERVGYYLAQIGDYIASGNALGSDAAYARGANRSDPTRVILYLPWASYNAELIVKGNHTTIETRPAWEAVARKHHPIFDQLKRGAKAMMIRNAGILSKADACVAFLNKNKSGGGGTGHGWRIAGEMGIPRIDLSDLDTANRVDMKKLFDFLKNPLTA